MPRRRGADRPGSGYESRHALCQAAESGRRAPAEALLAELRALAGSGPAAEAAAALDELLGAAPRLWIGLDRYARGGAVTGPRDPVRQVPRDAGPLSLVLASFDADGRLRQAAVERLAVRGGRYAATALALRTDDWVTVVRERARAALTERLAPEEAVAAVRVLVALRGRARAGEALREYRAALCGPERRDSVRLLAADPDPRTRRFGVELALELGEYARDDLALAALHDPDQVCRARCAQALLDLDPDQAGRLMWAGSAAVRELAVAALPDDIAAPRLVSPLADRSRMVRAQARWKLYKRGEPPAEVYRRQLRRCGRGTPARLVAGLATGLGECGEARDAPMLTVLAEDASWPPVARRAAVRALGRLAAGALPPGRAADAADPAARVLASLAGDPLGCVAREALDALVGIGAARPPVLRAALERAEPEVRRAAVRATRTASYFDRLELLLAAVRDPRADIAARARAGILEWRRAPFAGGGADQAQLPRIRGLLLRAGLPEAERAMVELVLRYGTGDVASGGGALRAQAAVGDLDLADGEAEALGLGQVAQRIAGGVDVADGAAAGAHQVLVGVVGVGVVAPGAAVGGHLDDLAE